MEISRTNYEMFFLDYIEGNLSPEKVKELMLFLELNPDLKAELENFELITLDKTEEISFSHKEMLKKPLYLNELDKNRTEVTEKFIAYHEGDLNPAEMNEVKELIRTNTKYFNEFEQLRQCYLQPDYSIEFSARSSLKKLTVLQKTVRTAVYASAIAASLLIVFYISTLFNNQQYFGNQLQTATIVLTPDIATKMPAKINQPYQIVANKEKTNNNSIKLDIDKVIPSYLTSKSIDNLALQNNAINTLISQNSSNIINIDVIAGNWEKEDDYVSDIPKQEDYMSVKEFAFNKIRKLVFRNAPEDNNPVEDITIWNLASIGLGGINRLTDNNFKLNRTYEEGKLTAYAITNDKYTISRTVKEK